VFSTIIVPPAVVTETRPVVRPAWIVERSLTRPLPLRVVSEELGRGERETIGLALELDVEAGLDERRGRRVAQSLGIRVVGTLGVLLLAKEAGVISAIRPHIDALLATEFYLSPWLIADALALANENG
jgi:predicted nucleic acid-binding protein